MNIQIFTAKAISEATDYINSKEMISKREIVKGITIDGAASRDLDDGINLYIKNGNYLLQVSIADVTEAVRRDSELYEIALKRLETRYLRNSNLPMLPKILSENKMSLVAGRLRPAITFDIEMNPELDVVSFDMKETAFLNVKRFSYHEFDNVIKKADESFKGYKKLVKMTELANKLIDKRRQKGALAIYDIIRGIRTDEEGNIVAMEKGMNHISNLVVQEFMILTNKLTAWFFAQHDLPFLNRNHTVKHSAPDRSEIMEQINTVLVNPEHLESLRTRGTLWFNRAVYSPVVKGHFGLNEPVYSHVTSPIRRIADLINHYIIKAYIRKEEPPFTIIKLSELSNDINAGIAEIKDKKSEMFKEKAIEKGALKINYYTEMSFTKLKDSEFSEILYAAAKSDMMNDRLKNAIETKIKKNKIDMNMLFTILFKSKPNSPEWSEVIQICLLHIKENTGLSVAILNILVQKTLLEKYDIDITQMEKVFKVKITALQNGIEIRNGNYSISPRKKDAISFAAFNILRLMLNLPEETQEVTEPASEGSELNNIEENTETSNPLSEEFIIDLPIDLVGSIAKQTDISEPQSDTNYVGRLLEMCNKNRSWVMSDYTISLSGPSHLPSITCSAKLTTPEHTIEESAVTSNKKTAKQEVARKIMEKLNQTEISEIKPQKTEEKLSSDNPIGNLQEYCVKMKYPNPDYIFTNVGNINKPMFECELSVVFKGTNHKFKSVADNKKSAKYQTAEECMQKIDELTGK